MTTQSLCPTWRCVLAEVSFNQFVSELRKRFQENTSGKTGWGKNELMSEFEKSLTEAMAYAIDQSKEPSRG